MATYFGIYFSTFDNKRQLVVIFSLRIGVLDLRTVL
jgi:hypothetical protein